MKCEVWQVVFSAAPQIVCEQRQLFSIMENSEISFGPLSDDSPSLYPIACSPNDGGRRPRLQLIVVVHRNIGPMA